jgi:hypothetical protein
MMERDHLEDPGVDGSITLKLILKKWNGFMDWIVLAWYKDRWCAEASHKPCGSIKCGEFHD